MLDSDVKIRLLQLDADELATEAPADVALRYLQTHRHDDEDVAAYRLLILGWAKAQRV